MAKDHVDRMLDAAGIERTNHSTVEVLGRLYRLVTFAEKRLAAAYATAGLNHGEVDVLNALVRAGGEPQHPTRVAASLLCSSGAMTNRLDRLEKAGLIRRRHASADRRSILLSITAKGEEAARRANEAREAIAHELLPGLTKADRKTLVDLLRRTLVELETEETVAV
jgi:DNA-binding MarR family transcriptional regulator